MRDYTEAGYQVSPAVSTSVIEAAEDIGDIIDGVLDGVVDQMAEQVDLVVLSIETLGFAILRAITSGKAHTVTVPDERTADVFRAALAETQKSRPTDRLIEVVVSGR